MVDTTISERLTAALGRGIIVIDDPQVTGASAPKEDLESYFDQTAFYPIADGQPPVFIQSRLHEADMVGTITDSDGVAHLDIPTTYDPGRPGPASISFGTTIDLGPATEPVTLTSAPPVQVAPLPGLKLDPHAMSDLDVVARTLWGEDRGGGVVGMEAVAGVIMNRQRLAKIWMNRHQQPHPEYGDGTFKDACLRSGQFDCWNDFDPNYSKLVDPQWGLVSSASVARMVAGALLDGTLADPTGGAVCYYAPKVVVKAPSWASKMQITANIGGQLFFK